MNPLLRSQRRLLYTGCLLALLQVLYSSAAAQCLGGRFDTLRAESQLRISRLSYRSTLNYLQQHVTLQAELYQSDSDSVQNRPLVLLLHGGAFVSGDYRDVAIDALARQLARRGYVAAALQYRQRPALALNPSRTGVAAAAVEALQDIRAAIRYFKSNDSLLQLDSAQLFLLGLGAGATTALHVPWLRSAAQFHSWADSALLAPLGGLQADEAGAPSDTVRGLMLLSGSMARLDWLSSGGPSTLLLHGQADSLVPYRQGLWRIGQPVVDLPMQGSYLLDSALRSIGSDVLLRGYPSAGHLPLEIGSSGGYLDSVLQVLLPWLQARLDCGRFVTGRGQVTSGAGVLQAWPNPCRDRVQIAGLAEGRLSLHDPHGHLLGEWLPAAGQTRLTLDLSGLPPGIYLLQQRGTMGAATLRLCVF